MAKRKFSKEEVEQWQKEHNQTVFYINKNDSNLFVKRRYSFGWTVNLTHPVAWIIIATVSRFARNTLDCLNFVRLLKDLGIGVIFEKENINTLDSKGEVLLSILS